jgi:hypothetical protein
MILPFLHLLAPMPQRIAINQIFARLSSSIMKPKILKADYQILALALSQILSKT